MRHKDLGWGWGGGDTAQPGTLFSKPSFGSLPATLICLSVPGLECELWGVISSVSSLPGPGSLMAGKRGHEGMTEWKLHLAK